ncbi:GAF domain-containing protein [Methylobacterium sp.]|uniref:GAF domain-containing protein n=1 Tax=Methylobacterium sp. TaxID=409 RepID=UPI0025CED8A6|nr:GAF domain-containing protein [Methylobacterium sp.]
MVLSVENESERVAALHRLQVLGTPPEPAFDRITKLAQKLFGVPIAIISLMDEEQQWFKAKCGVDIAGTPREHAFCNYTIMHDSVFVVPDAAANPTFAANPFVTGDPYIRFYAGAPLTIERGIRLGSLCVIDTQPREFDAADSARLTGLAQMVVGELWLRDQFRESSHHEVIEQERHLNTQFDFEIDSFLFGPQVRAARGLLNWSISDLSAAANVSANTIKRVESSNGNISMRHSTVTAIRNAFLIQNISFTGYNKNTAGVRVCNTNK